MKQAEQAAQCCNSNTASNTAYVFLYLNSPLLWIDSKESLAGF